MTSRVATLACLLMCHCSSAAVPDAPLVTERPAAVQPDAQTPEADAVREMLGQFLTARWSYDVEAMKPFLTPDDHEHAQRAMHPHTPDRNPISRVAWTIQDLTLDGDEAVARVEVIKPVDPIYFWFGGVDIEYIVSLPTAVAQQAAAEQMRIDRGIETLTYQLRRADAGWVVVMKWGAAADLHENMHNTVDQQLALHRRMDAFSGSEAEVVRTRSTFSAPDDPGLRALHDAIDDAERCVAARDFQCAAKRYDAFIATAAVPAFVTERRESLKTLEAEHKRRIALAGVKLVPAKPADGTLNVEVSFTGARVDSVEVVVRMTQYDVDDHETRRASNLQPGKSETVEFSIRDATRVDTPYVGEIDFHKSVDVTEFPFEPLAFRRAREDLATDNHSRRDPIRVVFDVRSRIAEFERCPDFPAAFADIRVDVGDAGTKPRFTAVGDDVSSAFSACVAEVGDQLALPDSEHVGAMLRIYPPR